MLEVVPFERRHLKEMQEQEAMSYLSAYLNNEHLLHFENSHHSFTFLIDKRVVMCAGVLEFYPGRGEAWAILDKSCKKDFMKIHNGVERFLDLCPVKRIEAVIDTDFVPGHRWAKTLGFQMEAPCLKAYRPNGKDCSMYARIK